MQLPRLQRSGTIVVAVLACLTIAACAGADDDAAGEDVKRLNQLAVACYASDFAACDELFRDAPGDGVRSRIGQTCGDRLSGSRGGLCAKEFSDTTDTTDTTDTIDTTDRPDTSLGDVAPTVGVVPDTYQIVIAGEVSGNSFERPGELIVSDTLDSLSDNDLNAVDFCILSGSPLGSPEIGAFRWGTSAGCLPGSAQPFDLAYVTLDGSSIVAEPVENVGAVSTAGFNARSGLAAVLYVPVSGTVEMMFDAERVTGTINLEGFCGFCTGGLGDTDGTYTATFSSP